MVEIHAYPDDQTDADWEHFGQQEPYWAVLTENQFRKEKIDDDARRVFFQSGQRYIDRIFQTIRSHLYPSFSPRRAIDFGCGVGRLTVPLAKSCAEVVGIDVSQGMLNEARANCESFGLSNVSLVKGDDQLAEVSGRFDFVNSFIVLQHIPCGRGMNICRRLVELLADDGVGAIHFTYANTASAENANPGNATWPTAPANRPRNHAGELFRIGMRCLKGIVFKRKRADDSRKMQMNPYALNPLMMLLQEAGARETYIEFTDHGGHFGVLIYFRKKANAPYLA